MTKPELETRRKPRRSKIAFMAMAFFAWGSWAYWVHREYPLAMRLKPAIAQGTLSALLTLILALFTERVYAVLRSSAARHVAPALLAVSLTTTISVTVHLVLSTPLVFRTLVPNTLVGFAYCLYVTRQAENSSVKPS